MGDGDVTTYKHSTGTVKARNCLMCRMVLPQLLGTGHKNLSPIVCNVLGKRTLHLLYGALSCVVFSALAVTAAEYALIALSLRNIVDGSSQQCPDRSFNTG